MAYHGSGPRFWAFEMAPRDIDLELVALVINFLCEASQMSILGSDEWVQSALCQQAMPEATNILSEYNIVRLGLKFQLIRQAGPVVEGSWGCRVRERLGNAAAITACASG